MAGSVLLVLALAGCAGPAAELPVVGAPTPTPTTTVTEAVGRADQLRAQYQLGGIDLPSDWPEATLKRIHAFGRCWNLTVQNRNRHLRVLVTDQAGETIYDAVKPPGDPNLVLF